MDDDDDDKGGVDKFNFAGGTTGTGLGNKKCCSSGPTFSSMPSLKTAASSVEDVASLADLERYTKIAAASTGNRSKLSAARIRSHKTSTSPGGSKHTKAEWIQGKAMVSGEALNRVM